MNDEELGGVTGGVMVMTVGHLAEGGSNPSPKKTNTANPTTSAIATLIYEEKTNNNNKKSFL